MNSGDDRRTGDLEKLQLYSAAFYSSPDFISVSRTRDAMYLEVNPGFERFTGYSRADVVGKSAFHLGIWADPADRDAFVTELRKTGEVRGHPTRLLKAGAEVCPVEISARIARVHEDEVMIVVVRDITERVRQESELRRYRDHLEQLVDERTRELLQANEALLRANRKLEDAHGRLLESEQQIRFMAQHDVLTGLPNRALLQDRIHQAVSRAARRNGAMAVLFVDLDNFKYINDSLGHLMGDRLLRVVAERLQGCVRASDTVARIGGDEFVVSLPDLAAPSEAAVVAQKILDALDTPLIIDGTDLHAGASIGISLFPSDGANVDELMQAADTAMYSAKSRGRGNYQFFTPALNAAAQLRLTLERQLRQAIARGEFVLHFQPQVHIRSGRIFAAEALVRWQHPERGMVGPAEFIPVAEESGLIVPIGEWVLREACRELAALRAAGHGELSVAVNISARQMMLPGFPGLVQSILQEAGLPGDALDLEITESVLMQPTDENSTTLDALAATGARLSVDDFGTGYSSLSYLSRFPIRALKIDRSFVSGQEAVRESARAIPHQAAKRSDMALAHTIVAMAAHLGLEVIAEGVETAEQADQLARHGCTAAQGFYYASPMPAAELALLLTRQLPLSVARSMR